MNEHHLAHVRNHIEALRKSRDAVKFWPGTLFLCFAINAVMKLFVDGVPWADLKTDPASVGIMVAFIVSLVVHIAVQTIVDGQIHLAEIALDHAYREIEERRDPMTNPKPWDFADKK